MTIAQLYKWARKRGCEHAPIIIDYTCTDDWYNYYGAVTENDVTIRESEVVLQIDN